MDIKKLQIIPEPIVPNNQAKNKMSPDKPAESFQDVLFRELDNARQIKISAHAQRRLVERNIDLNQKDWGEIASAMNKAASKGSINSLLIHGEMALIVSVKNRTVISAMNKEDLKEHVFTNIDSAVIIK